MIPFRSSRIESNTNDGLFCFLLFILCLLEGDVRHLTVHHAWIYAAKLGAVALDNRFNRD